MANFTRNYEQLSEFILYAENSYSVAPNSVLRATVTSDNIKYIVACMFFGIALDEPLKVFRSNRYFFEAIGLGSLPSLDNVQKLDLLINSNDDMARAIEQIYEDAFAATGIVDQRGYLKLEFDKFSEDGYVILEGILDTSFCDELLKLVKRHASFEMQSSRGGYIYGDGKMQRVHNLVTKDEQFRQLLECKPVHALMERVFHRNTFHSKYYLSSFQANILGPGATPQVWHIDANVPEPLPSWLICANANFLIHDYNAETGSTEVIPGSHKWHRRPCDEEVNTNHSESLVLQAPKGSIILWDGYLWHRSGYNKSTEDRVALLSNYAASFLREICMQENVYLSSSIMNQISYTATLKRILGWHHGLKNYGG